MLHSDLDNFFYLTLNTGWLKRIQYPIPRYSGGGGGRGGGYFRNCMTVVCGPNFEDIPYSYKGQARKPYLFILYDIKHTLLV